jgi:DNA mismatch repair protein MutS
VREWKEEIVFLRRLVPGGTNRSYGIQVGRLAGLPRAVISRAREILAGLEEGRGEMAMGKAQLSLFAPPSATAGDAAHTGPTAVEQCILDVDPNAVTPIEALTLLSELRAKLTRA